MGRAEAAREEAIKLLAEAQPIADRMDAGTPRQGDERRFGQLWADAQDRLAEFRTLKGIAVADLPSAAAGVAKGAEARELLHSLSGKGDVGPAFSRDGTPVPGGMVWASGNRGGEPGGRRSFHQESWGQAVVDAMTHGAPFMSVVGSGSVPVTVPLRSEPVTEARRVLFLRQLIPAVPAPGGRFSYMKQTVRTNNAAPVADFAVKATSIYTLVRVDDRTRTIAHLSEPIPRNQISDAPMLRQFVDDELRYGLDLAVDSEILNGDGTGEHLPGILDAGIQTQDFDTDVLVTARKAITKLEVVDLTPNGWAINPLDWETIELLSAEQFAANSNQPSPANAMTRRLWGFPVVVTNAVNAGTAILGAFDSSSELHVTEDARVDWSENVYDPDALGPGDGASDFSRNLIRFRAEGRWGLAVTRPLGFVAVDLGAGS